MFKKTKKQITTQMILDAHFAQCTDEDVFDLPISADDKKAYRNGKEVLKSYKLVYGTRYQRGTASIQGPWMKGLLTVDVSAGHIAGHEAVCPVGLKPL